MNLTISLDAAQANSLEQHASARQLTPEQLASALLRDALGKIADDEAWGALDRRRIDLIRKSRAAGLSAEESRELEQLQAAVDQRLEPMDRQLLAAAGQFRKLAEGLADEPSP